MDADLEKVARKLEKYGKQVGYTAYREVDYAKAIQLGRVARYIRKAHAHLLEALNE